MAVDGTAITRLYPTIHQLYANPVEVLEPAAINLRDALTTAIRSRFPWDDISDDILAATFLHPSNVGHAMFEGEEGGELLIRARNRIMEEQRHLLRLDKKSYLADDTVGEVEDDNDVENPHRVLQRRLKHTIDQYIDMAKEDTVADPKKPEDWWKPHRRLLPLLVPIVRVFYSIQASSAASERLFSLAGNVLTDNRNNLSKVRLNRMVLMNAWNREYNRNSEQTVI